ncbi:hypothetical protein NQZ68_039953 [Dissostichus eleginoides]|nr:hypothetical protein NQZ68_039953 [Dissostichus eleginoides]
MVALHLVRYQEENRCEAQGFKGSNTDLQSQTDSVNEQQQETARSVALSDLFSANKKLFWGHHGHQKCGFCFDAGLGEVCWPTERCFFLLCLRATVKPFTPAPPLAPVALDDRPPVTQRSPGCSCLLCSGPTVV